MKDEKEKKVRRTNRTTKKKDIEEKETVKKEVKKTVKKESDMKVVNKTVEFSLIEVIVIILITGIVVSITSGLIVYNNYDKINTKEASMEDIEFKEFLENYDKIMNGYVEKVDKDKLIDSAIQGMYNYLGDSYSMYLSEQDTKDLQEQLDGEYTGIGIEIRTDILEDGSYQTVVNRVFKNSPAEKSGIKAGDILLKIDGADVVDANSVANTIKRGNKDTYEVTYSRDGKENVLTLTREKVFINSVTSEVKGNVGIIKIDTFSLTTKEQIEKCINSFGKNVTSVVIDVRDNTGGYLKAAYDTADLFVAKGKVIYQLKDRNGVISKFEAENGVLRKFNKIAVLVNEGSASASEVLALALKESASAKVVGTKSFGKGTVQDTDTLSSGAMVKYTTSYWLSPNGNSINEVGIQPDKVVEDKDKQLEEAIKVVK